MIHKDLKFSVNIRAGVSGPILQEYDSEGGRISRSIEAVTGTVLCTQITLHKDFEWFDADGLYVAIRYGSRDYQIELWIPKPTTPELDDEDDWTIQIPGKNILDAATKQIAGCQYRFAELETWQCDKDAHDCVELRQGNERYLGTIWVSIKRRKVKNGLAPTSAKDNKDPKLVLKACQHTTAVGTEGVKHAVKNEQVAPFEMGVVIPNPKQDELTDLDDTGKHQGHVMNSIFVFRGKEQLSHVKPDPDESQDEGSTDKNTVTSKDPKSPNTRNAVLGKNATKKRRRVELDDSTVAETDPSLDDGSNIHSQRKKSKRSDKKVDLSVGLSSPAAGNSKSQDEERESLLNTFTQKPSREAKSGAKPLEAGQGKESRRSKGSDSVPKLGSVLNEEYRKLNAAGNIQRRSKSRAQPNFTSKNADFSQRTSITPASDSGQNSQTGSSKPSVLQKELGGPGPRNSTRRNSNLMGTDLETPLRTVEPDAKPATLEQEIKALQGKKERLEERLKRKLEAECEELERQLKG